MNKTKIVTHNGQFHADEVFAIAALKMHFDSVEIIRTRDTDVIDKGDVVVDVGMVYDETKNRFDHHQSGGAGKRDGGIPYASFGLVWKRFGAEICNSEEVSKHIDGFLVQAIDAIDNGVEISQNIFENVSSYTISNMISSFVPTWEEVTVTTDDHFMIALSLAHKVLEREIVKARARVNGREKVESAYSQSQDKRIIVLDDRYSWAETLMYKPEPLYVVTPNKETNSWHVSAVPTAVQGFERRKSFPQAWAGKREDELALMTGVQDAMFCHNALFLAVSKSKEGAIKLAKLAVEA